jgi:putative heme-binding domain-containing protein
MADGLWKPPFAEQPAYLTPALSNYSDGPVGFKWEPGTALDDHYRGWFFLAESTKKLTAFRAEPQGAGFRQVGAHLIAAGPFATGLAFGPDGALYAADWGDNEWLPHQRGRVIRYDDPAMAKDSARAQTRQLLAEGMAKRSAVQLQALLAHADQRVRLQAQFQLADSGEAGRKTLTMVASTAGAAAGAAVPAARLHAIWGLGQIARRRHDADALATLTGLLADADPEVRAQAAKMLGDADHLAAGDAVAKLLADPSPRPRLLAGIALARLGAPQHLPLAVAMLEANADHDVFLRHAGVMALSGSARADRAPLLALATHPAVAVRRAAVVALRMLGEPGVARFLDDADQAVAAEAARAIHDDLSIPAALPALAAVLAREDRDDDALLRRAISAYLRLGDEPSAKRLAAFAARRTAPAELRAEALDSLGAWGRPLVLDRVQAFHRGLPARDRAIATAAIAPSLEGLLFGKSKTVQRATARLIAALELADWRDRVSALAVDPARDADLRVIALATMEAMNAPQLDDAIAKALADSAAPLRAAALGTLARRHPKDDASYDAIAKVLASDALADRQLALGVLGTLTAKRAVAMLEQYLERWKAGTLPAELRLDVASAVRAQGDKGLKAKLAGLEKQLAAADPRGLAILALEGGDPVAGEKLVRGAGTISCLQCHSLGGGGSGVGPDLLHVASRLDRSRLLTALVDPSAEIAEGFGLVNLTLKDGTVLSGALASETATEVVIRPVGGQPQPVAKATIATRSKPVSIMPPMGANLTLVEMRDVVAYLATLK